MKEDTDELVYQKSWSTSKCLQQDTSTVGGNQQPDSEIKGSLKNIESEVSELRSDVSEIKAMLREKQ